MAGPKGPDTLPSHFGGSEHALLGGKCRVLSLPIARSTHAFVEEALLAMSPRSADRSDCENAKSDSDAFSDIAAVAIALVMLVMTVARTVAVVARAIIAARIIVVAVAAPVPSAR